MYLNGISLNLRKAKEDTPEDAAADDEDDDDDADYTHDEL